MSEVGTKTGSKTQAGKDVYKTPEGEMVSEKSTTFEYKGKWINVPTIHKGYSYDEDVIRMMLDAEVVKPTSVHTNKKDAIKAARERSKKLKFNEGGAVMSKSDMQMEMLLQEGGIADDGTTVDPVSGNEVPPGSMAEEVRDDVPAQLSEGEYVVPADVTRYYGVKFFEDLRTEAKQGMGQMEADGRIGGEPVSQTMDNQAEGALTPDELAMLQEMGMNVGGMVPPPQAVGNTTEYNKGGQVLYADAGVDVSTGTAEVDPYKAQFSAGMGANFGGGFLSQSVINNARTSRTAMLYSPDGVGIALTLPAEQARYDQLLSEGYTTESVNTTTETSVGVEEEREEGGGLGDGGQPDSTPDATPVGEMSDAQLSGSAKGLGLMGVVGTAVLGPVAGAALSTISAARSNDIMAEMKSRNMSEADDMDYQGSIFGGKSGLFEGLTDTSGDDEVTFADTWLGDLLGLDGKLGVQGPNLSDSFNGDRRDGPSTSSSTSSSSDSSGMPQGPTAAQEAMGEAEGEIGIDAFGGTGDSPDASPSDAPSSPSFAGTGVDPSGDPGTGGYSPFATGGLVKRPKKNKKRKK